MVCFVFLADLVGWLVGWLVGAVSLPFALVEIDEMNEFQQGRNEARIVWGSGRQCFRGDETVTSHHKKRKSGRCVLAKQEKQEKKMSPKNKKTKTRNRHPPRAHECENTQRDKRHTCQFLCMMSCPKTHFFHPRKRSHKQASDQLRWCGDLLLRWAVGAKMGLRGLVESSQRGSTSSTAA